MLSHDVMHLSEVMDCSEPFPQTQQRKLGREHTPHRLMKQTQCKLLIIFHRHSLYTASTRGADRHHLCVAVLESKFKIVGHLGTASSACPLVLLSVKTWRLQPSTLPSVGPCQLHKHFPHELLYLGWVICIMHACDGWVA